MGKVKEEERNIFELISELENEARKGTALSQPRILKVYKDKLEKISQMDGVAEYEEVVVKKILTLAEEHLRAAIGEYLEQQKKETEVHGLIISIKKICDNALLISNNMLNPEGEPQEIKDGPKTMNDCRTEFLKKAKELKEALRKGVDFSSAIERSAKVIAESAAQLILRD